MSTKIKTINFKSKNAGIEFVESLHHTGFAILHSHPINYKFIASVYMDWSTFFNSKEKYIYTFNPDTQDGYFPYRSENAKGYTNKDLKEFYHYYEWGKYPDNMSKNTIKLFNSLIEIGKNLLNWIDIYSPINIKSNYSIPLSEMIENSRMNLLRVIHYPPLTEDKYDGAIRAGAHEDINLITLLSPGSQPGLQVLNNDGDWMDVKCNPDWLVINTGDMLNECSQGYFPSTTHQVVNPIGDAAKISRYTIPLFVHPRAEVVLSDRYTARSFLDERLEEIGLKS